MQFFAYQRVREAVAEHGAKAGSVVVIDVLTGEVEWRKQYAYDELFESQNSLQEKLAKDFIEDIKKDYFLKLARKAG